MELLTLAQTQKLEKKIVILLYGSQFWKEILNFDALVRHGVISEKDLELFEIADDPPAALRLLQDGLTRYYLKPGEPLPALEQETPAIAKSRI
jgi:predicted Rossmann-fold nucleotide-binding protein